MADEKKEKKGNNKKEAPKGPDVSFDKFLTEVISIVVGFYILSRVVVYIKDIVETRGYTTDNPVINSVLSGIFYTAASALVLFAILSNVISVLLLMAVIYCVIRLNELAAEEDKKYNINSELQFSEDVHNPRWQKIQEHINSENPADWKLAILEADIVLDELLDKIGCIGSTISEKLKKVERSDFVTIESAWEAHKIRNAIAHEGSDFVITEREARRVIGLYEQVFQEFNIL